MGTPLQTSKNEASCQVKTPKKSDKTTKRQHTSKKPSRKARAYATSLILENKSMRQSAIDAGYAPATVKRACRDIQAQPSTQVAIAEAKELVRGDFTAIEQVQAIQETLDNKDVSDSLKLQVRMKLYEICKKAPSTEAIDNVTTTEQEQLLLLSCKPSNTIHIDKVKDERAKA